MTEASSDAGGAAAIEVEGDDNGETGKDGGSGDGGAGGAAGGDGGADGSKNTGGNAGAEWLNLLSEETRKADTFKKFTGKSLDDFAKSYVSLERTLTESGRKDAAIRPGQNAPQHEWDAYWAKLGRPAKPEEYELKSDGDLPDGVKLSDAFAKQFRERAHKAGLSKDQANLAYQEVVKANIGLHQALGKVQETRASDALNAVRTEYGALFEERMALVHQVMNRFLPDAAKAKVSGKYTEMAKFLGNNPAVMQMLYNISQEFDGDSLKFPGQTDTKTPQDLREELHKVNEELYKTSPTDPKRARLLAQAGELARKVSAG